MFENIFKFFKKAKKEEKPSNNKSKSTAKERLHLVLMQDRANVSADFLDLMKQEIIDVIKKYIEVDESAIDVRLTNKENEDGTNGAPALYANIPIITIKNEARKMEKGDNKTEAVNNEVNKENDIKNEEDKENNSEKIEDNNSEKQENEEKNIESDNVEQTNNDEEANTEEQDNKELEAEESTTENT